MAVLKPLAAKQLYQAADLSLLDFRTTAELDDLSEVVGQARALEAIHFGIGIKKTGYNIFALGPAGTGKHGVVTQLLQQKASAEGAPSDWCYVNNFEQSHKPIKLCLAKGMGRKLCQDMQQLIEALKEVFKSDEYHNEVEKLKNELKSRQEQVVDDVRPLAKSRTAEEVVISMVARLTGELFEKYKGHTDILNYLNNVQADVINNINHFRLGEGEPSDISLGVISQGSHFKRYEVNVLVEHSKAVGAPVVFEENPTYQNLVGRVEHMTMMGTLITDFTLIKPGALHQANNGYLVLEAYKLLQHPFSWESLKRALRSSEIHMGSLEQMQGLVTTISLEPEPIPLNLKVVLVGDRVLYYLLYQLDPEFQELFKVAADFDEQMDRSVESQHLYARLIATLVNKEALHVFDKPAVERIIEYSARMTEDANKLSIHMRSICDLMCEADYWTQQHGRDVVTADDVQTAINAQLRRSSRLEEDLHDNIQRDILLVDTCGSMVGQVNALSIVDLGNTSFGTPSRITARVRMGDDDVLDIEREVDLGGPIHSKGVLILSGFLGARYAKEQPLALTASLVFEQSYGEIEGDSASSAELYSLLSALSNVPIKQGFAVTGSVNQHGQVQAVGGVNEKIEGFFDVCAARSLTGEQGVLIPQSNVADLMLRKDIIAAVEQNMFQIYAVASIDQGIEILTGITAGELDGEGHYPEGSINFKVAHQLYRFAIIRHEFGESKKDEEGLSDHTEKKNAKKSNS